QPRPELEDRCHAGVGRWERRPRRGGSIRGRVREFPPGEREPLRRLGVVAVAVVPIRVGGGWWGYLGFDHCEEHRVWSDADVEAMSAAAVIIGAAIDRQMSEEARAESEEQYRRLIELSPFAIMVHQQGQVV